MPSWFVVVLRKLLPWLVSEAVDFAKDRLYDHEVDEAIDKVSQVAQKISDIKNGEQEGSPVGHIPEDTKAKALLVAEGALSIAEMIDEAF